VAIGSIGLPLPASIVKSGGASFPCQHCACGCADADDCWRNCCCYTQTQKLAWAKRNGVKPPAFVVAAARQEAGAIAKRAPCCRARAAVGAESACCSRRQYDKPGTADAASRGRRVVMLIQALRCRGIGVSIGLLPPSLRPAPFDVGQPPYEPPGEYPAGMAILYASPSFDVATRPPAVFSPHERPS